jgi:hypothetical protein
LNLGSTAFLALNCPPFQSLTKYYTTLNRYILNHIYRSATLPDFPSSPRSLIRRSCLPLLLGLSLLCLAASLLSLWSNASLPTEDPAPPRLQPLDAARLSEALHLRASLGDALWPGFGAEPIPVILHYGQASFLVGYPGSPPAAGGIPAAWQPVSADAFQGQPYYRKPETDPQNFAILVGETWVAGMASKTMTDAFLIQVYRDLRPPVLEQIFPYRLLIQPSETQIAAVIHESFHVYQARCSPQRLQAAESAHASGDRYWAADTAMHPAWQEEARLLIAALEAKTDAETRQLARQFLQNRQQRRQAASLSPDLAAYERWLEWEEGLAKYTEIKILQLAYETAAYQPTPEIETDPEFDAYQGFPRRWSQELIQLRLQAGQEGESRFYQTGLALAYLLDRLDPAWKEKAFEDGAFLEDLLDLALE